MHYEDFVIQLGPEQGGSHPAWVLQSPAGEGQGRFLCPVDQLRLQSIWRQAEVARDRGRQRNHGGQPAADLGEPSPADDLREIGRRLFEALFAGQVRSLYDHSLGIVQAVPDTGLRIKLKLDPSESSLAPVYDLPWEFLHRCETGLDLALQRTSPLVRYLAVPRPTKTIPLPPTLRVLVVVASPAGLASLGLEQERRAIRDAWRRLTGVELVFLTPATPAALRETLLAGEFHVLHFMGHGGYDPMSGEGLLYFEDDDGEVHSLSGRALAEELGDFDSLGLVFLNACETARAACGSRGGPLSGVAGALLMAGIPAVVAMQFPITDQAAIHFSRAFYRRLAVGDSVDEALTEGRRAVRASDPESMEWGTPVLFVRVSDGTVFRPSVAKTPAPVASGAKRKGPRGVARWVVTLIVAIALTLLVQGGYLWLSSAEVEAVESETPPEAQEPVDPAAGDEEPGAEDLQGGEPGKKEPGDEKLESVESEGGKSVDPVSAADRDEPTTPMKRAVEGSVVELAGGLRFVILAEGIDDGVVAFFERGFRRGAKDASGASQAGRLTGSTVLIELAQSAPIPFEQTGHTWYSCRMESRPTIEVQGSSTELERLSEARTHVVSATACEDAADALGLSVVQQLIQFNEEV